MRYVHLRYLGYVTVLTVILLRFAKSIKSRDTTRWHDALSLDSMADDYDDCLGQALEFSA